MEIKSAALIPEKERSSIMNNFFMKLPGGQFREFHDSLSPEERDKDWQRRQKFYQVLDKMIPPEEAERMRELNETLNRENTKLNRLERKLLEEVEKQAREEDWSYERERQEVRRALMTFLSGQRCRELANQAKQAKTELERRGWKYFQELKKQGFSIEELSR